VRDVVARQPELVNEVWCRKIFRHALQLLERHHALGQAHALLTPDTIGFDPNGGPVLLATGDAAAEPGEAADVQALGAVVHFAITGEAVPSRLLRARAPAGYSDSFLTAVDKCIARDPGERPQSIAGLRELLGIVALRPAVPVVTAAPLHVHAEPPVRGAITGLGKWQRRGLIGLAGVVLLATASAFFMLLRGTNPGDNVVLTLPQALPPAQTLDPNEILVQAPPAPAVAQAPASAAAVPAPASAAAVPAPAAPGPTAQAELTSYKLLVKPWGTVYVDGTERGVSPPLKRLSLPAGRHTVRIVNPNFRDRVIRVGAGRHGPGRIDVDFNAVQP
jgi:hypothetical protein